MAKKTTRSIGEEIARIEIDRLYDKAVNSSTGLDLEDIKKLDILLKNLRESQEENYKVLEAQYEKIQERLNAELPTDLLADFVGESLGDFTNASEKGNEEERVQGLPEEDSEK